MDRNIVVPLYSLLETRENPTVLVDKDYRIVAANKAYCSSYGVPPEEIIGKRCHEVSHRSDRPCHLNGEQCPHQEVFATSGPSEALHTHIDFEGRPDHVRILAHPIHDADGQMYLMESIHRLAPRLDISCEEMRMAGKSPAFLAFFEELSVAATTSAAVWLYGESGVGKELAARFLHEHSVRGKKPYVELNCASVPESLCESELFGHDKGAFTGSVRSKRGLFELADGGTLFLDEIGDLPLAMQGKLLRVLDCGEFRRLGSETISKCDVRVIAATNRDLAQMVRDGQFRQDLYYRIAGYKVTIPPLRARKEDIPAIAQVILSHLGIDTKLAYKLTADALSALMAYDYPGNIRELRSILVKAAAKCKHGVIQSGDINFDHLAGCACTQETPDVERREAPSAAVDLAKVRSYGRRRTDNPGAQGALDHNRRDTDEDMGDALADIEKQKIQKLLAQHSNRRIVADKLGISERTLYRKIKSYGLKALSLCLLNVALGAPSEFIEVEYFGAELKFAGQT
jgi:transcriptional regulator with PAS, ATPase and Fis domain